MKRTLNLKPRSFIHGLAPVALALLAACGSASKRTNPASAAEPMGPNQTTSAPAPNGEVYGPQPGENSSSATVPDGGSAPSIENPDRVVLVFGPGLVHGYAYVGVLRALRELKVAVHSVYGTELGALAGALYYTQPNPNRIDWALLRFTDRNLQKPTGKFSFRLKSPEGDLEAKLREVFGETRLESLNGKLHIALEDARSQVTFEATNGELWRILRGALAGANGFSPFDFEGREVRATRRDLSESFRIARQREGYPVLVFSAGQAPNEDFRRHVLEQRGEFIHIPMGSISNVDMKQRNQAAFQGKSAVHRSAQKILRLIGRDPETRE